MRELSDTFTAAKFGLIFEEREMVSLDTRDPKKIALSDEVARQVSEWEAKHGKVQTTPCGVGAKAIPWSINKNGKAAKNPAKPSNLDMDDDE
jgi:hypothetical protein